MASKLDSLLPSATAFAEKLALAEAEAAKQAAQRVAQIEAEKAKLMEAYTKPSGLSDEEGIRRGIALIERAVANGLTGVQFYRFPNALCTDGGRAINQGEPGWPETLTGRPKEIYELWLKHFRAKGYKLSAQIVDFEGGVPGDVGFTMSWV
jgi:hypothetical protein